MSNSWLSYPAEELANDLRKRTGCRDAGTLDCAQSLRSRYWVTVSAGAAITWPLATSGNERLARAADDALHESTAHGHSPATVYGLDKPVRAAPRLDAVAV